MKKSKRKSSTESNNSNPTTVLPNPCIFCNKDKYVKETQTRERHSDCTTICADERVQKVALERNDSAVIVTSSDKLIAKEAHYHATCYRSYTRPNCTPIPEKRYDIDLNNVWKFLSDLYDNPAAVPFKRFQELVATPSEKKNLRRTIENRTDCYKFVKIEKEFLIYPTSLEMDDIVKTYYQTSLQLEKLQKMESKEKVVSESARIIREEIKNVSYRMSWPPTSKDLDVNSFVNSTYLDMFLVNLFSSDDDRLSERVSRLKSSFGQDMTYAGNCLKNKLYSIYCTLTCMYMIHRITCNFFRD